MSLFENFSTFLESKLDEFLLRNPHLELEVLLEELNEEKQDTIKLINQLTLELPKLEKEIISVAQEIQKWHARIDTAEASQRFDLAKAAREKENDFLRLGHFIWNERASKEKHLTENKELLIKIEKRQKEVKQKLTEVKAKQGFTSSNNWDNFSTNQRVNYSQNNSNLNYLEKQFESLETDEEIAKMKRDLNL